MFQEFAGTETTDNGDPSRRLGGRSGAGGLNASRRVVSIGLLAFALIVSLVGCKSKESSSSNSAGERLTLQLNWKPEPQFGGFYAAREGGFYAKHGLDVDVVEGGVGTPTVQMVAAGKVPFAVVSADEIIIARARGADVVALFAVYQTNPQGLMTHAAREFKSIGDIFTRSGSVAMQRGLPYASFLEKKYGFDTVKIVPSPGGDLSAFRSNPDYTMQCFVTSEPINAKRAGLDPQAFLIADAGYNPYTTVLVTRGDYLASNGATVASMVQAVREGWEAYLADPRPTNQAMGKLNSTMDAEIFAAAADAQKPLIQTADTSNGRLGSMTRQRWEELCRQLKDLKVVEKDVPPDDCFRIVGPSAAK